MYEQEHHEMELVVTHPSGAEEWFCPICRRRFLMQWSPAYSMMVIEPGDALARHSGSKGGLRIGATEALADEEVTWTDDPNRSPTPSSSEATEVEDTPITDELRPWLKWLENANLDDERDETA